MSKRTQILIGTFAFGAIFPVIFWCHYAFLRGNPRFAYTLNAVIGITVVCLLPFTLVAAGIGIRKLYDAFRAPDVVITVTERATPLMAKFFEQDRRLEKRERLKSQLFALNGEIETFAAELSPDDRKAWQNRPGPYGK